MTNDAFAASVESIKGRLYKTAMLYMGSHSQALDVLDEAIYKAYRGHKKLRSPEYFNTWITRILINECINELRRQKRFCPMDDLPETTAQAFDHLSLKEAIARLPQPLKDIVVLRYFSGFTLAETARLLEIPQGTAATRQRRALQLLRLELCEEATT